MNVYWYDILKEQMKTKEQKNIRDDEMDMRERKRKMKNELLSLVIAAAVEAVVA